MNATKKHIWYQAESIVAEWLSNNHYQIIERNYTIRWWEIDIIAQYKAILIFIEVKVVDHVFDLHDYITSAKLKHLHKTIWHYLNTHTHYWDIQLDVIFVRSNMIVQHIKNVTGER